jgi:hypothetical protein
VLQSALEGVKSEFTTVEEVAFEDRNVGHSPILDGLTVKSR